MKPEQRALAFYRRHLSRFFLLRLCKASCVAGFQRLYRLWARILRKPFSGDYFWLALSKTHGHYTARYRIASRQRVLIPAPIFLGCGEENAATRTPALEQNSPAIDVFEFSNAVIVGGTDFIFLGGNAIHHDLFVPGEHCCPAENLGVISQFRNGSRVSLRLTRSAPEMDAGVSLLGPCSNNYAHWLTENLTKLAVLNASSYYKGLPLLVDAGLHPNILESIDVINSTHRKIVQVHRWAPVRVSRLATLSAPAYERYAPHAVSGREPDPYINIFSGTALTVLREAALAELGDSNVGTLPTNIYLSRNQASSNLRQVANIDDVEKYLEQAGIQRFQPDSMSFREQIRICRNARLIVGPIGASLANMIFAPPGCRIVCLAPYYDEASYFYYANLAGILGHQIFFVLGEQTSKTLHPMHRSYVISLERLVASLQ